MALRPLSNLQLCDGELVIHTFIPSVQKQRERSSDPESGKVSNLQYLHR